MKLGNTCLAIMAEEKLAIFRTYRTGMIIFSILLPESIFIFALEKKNCRRNSFFLPDRHHHGILYIYKLLHSFHNNCS
jgi:hypothetical protein